MKNKQKTKMGLQKYIYKENRIREKFALQVQENLPYYKMVVLAMNDTNSNVYHTFFEFHAQRKKLEDTMDESVKRSTIN